MTRTGTNAHKGGTKKLYLVRHGETQYNAAKRVQGRGIDSELSELGIKQARALANSLKYEPFDFVCASTLKRAVQTAEIIKQEHVYINNVKLHTSEEICEMAFGQWEGKVYGQEQHPESVYSELQVILNKWREGMFDAAAPGGESPLQVQQRALNFIHEVLSKEDVHCALIVCHGRLLKILLSSILEESLQHMHKYDQDNTAVNVLEYDATMKIFRAAKLNCTAHLKEEVGQ